MLIGAQARGEFLVLPRSPVVIHLCASHAEWGAVWHGGGGDARRRAPVRRIAWRGESEIILNPVIFQKKYYDLYVG
jgi:hypothetical protein